MNLQVFGVKAFSLSYWEHSKFDIQNSCYGISWYITTYTRRWYEQLDLIYVNINSDYSFNFFFFPPHNLSKLIRKQNKNLRNSRSMSSGQQIYLIKLYSLSIFSLRFRKLWFFWPSLQPLLLATHSAVL